MNENLPRLKAHLKEKGLKKRGEDPGLLAKEIMLFAHAGQRRENEEPYANHPLRVASLYSRLLGEGPNRFDKALLAELGFPNEGVEEVCLLHDVLEDTIFTMDDLREVYKEYGLLGHFEKGIEEGLARITHDKKEGYPAYIKTCLGNPVSALVKMLDMQDNLIILDLVSLDEQKRKRSHGYLDYIAEINDKWHFLEKAALYREKAAKNEKENG